MIQLLVPPLQQGGVYDFACKLREALGADKAALVHLSPETAGDWKVGPDDTVFLQFSGYGFARRGAPLWLLRAIEARRKRIKTLGVFFHELYAFGPPWSSAFWISPLQHHIARRLARLADFWMTSREGSAAWLRQAAADKPHAVLPVFSTIGEPNSLPGTRQARIVVFGSPGLRRDTYLAAGGKLFDWARRASLEVHDIGSPMADAQLEEALRTKGVVLHGRLAAEEIRRLMCEAEYGLLAYPIPVIAKSSVFSAFCGHGLCPILISDDHAPTDGLMAGKHYWTGIPTDDPS